MNTNKNQSTSKDMEGMVTLSTDPDTEGFDMQAGETWIYPTNYTLRDYQHSIIQEALLKNTMVSLPTGLGKTFIAAVVMYNFYRWYPAGKIIFMAPTRPLVKQQIDACYKIMAIPKEATAELTGTKAQTLRKEVWKEKRVFFITPQVLQNDLGILTELGSKIKCLVFDEAHKAKGNHAYCEVIRRLLPLNEHFRVLGLSATPGSTLADVLGVIQNLLISHLEIRTDDSQDVLPYIFQRSLESVVVPLGQKLEEVRDNYMQILEKYTRVLIQHKVITGNCSTLTKGRIFMTMKDYQERNKNGRDRAYSEILRNLNICITLYHAYELLIRHGLRGFLSFYEEHMHKPLLRGNVELQQIVEDVRLYLGPAPNVETLPDGTTLEISESTKFGHPKFYKLRDILSDHFTDTNNSGSRVIVFCEYRESVMEAYALLLRYKPLIRAKIFLGQGAITQRQQINVVKSFKAGECNTLISTCIGEEGLDVGDVDLIVCFDINNKSPIRMVQRMGRTGRKRQGRVVVLVTEGKEQQTLKECLIHKQNLTNHILQSSALYKEMYAKNPRMVPAHIDPKCQKMYITVTSDTNQQLAKKKSTNLKDMFESISRKKSGLSPIHDNCDIKALEVEDCLPVKQEYWNKQNPLSIEPDKTRIDFSKRLSKLRVLQPTGEIRHSRSSEMLVSLLQFAESKKYNIPMSQVPVLPSQVVSPKKTKKGLSSDGYKQADIRNMFFKCSGSQLPNIADLRTPEEKEESSSYKETLNKLYQEVGSYLAITVENENNCKICENLFDCSQFRISSKEVDITAWIEPEYSIFDSLTVENLNIFAESMSPKSKKLYNKLNSPENINLESDTNTKTINTLQNDREDSFHFADRTVTYFDDTFGYRNSPFKAPSSVQKVFKKLNLDDSALDNIPVTQMETESTVKVAVQQNHVSETSNSIIACTLDVKAFEDAEFTQLVTKPSKDNDVHNKSIQETLSFFNITALEELFNESSLQTPSKMSPHNQSSQDTILYSPNCSNSNQKQDVESPESSSPILCTFDRARLLKNKAHKRLFETSLQGNPVTQNAEEMQGKEENYKNATMDKGNNAVKENVIVNSKKPNLARLLKRSEATKCEFYKSKHISHAEVALVKNEKCDEKINDGNSSDIIDTSVDDIFESDASSHVIKKDKIKSESETNKASTNRALDINDMFDLSIFGLSTAHITKSQGVSKSIINNDNTDCNLDEKVKCNKIDNKNTVKNSVETTSSDSKVTHKQEIIESGANTAEVLNDFCDSSFLDMFFESDAFEEDKDINKNVECKNKSLNKENKDSVVNTVNFEPETSLCDGRTLTIKENISNVRRNNLDTSADPNGHLLNKSMNNIVLNTATLPKTEKLGIYKLNDKEKCGNNIKQRSSEENEMKMKKWDETNTWDFWRDWDKNEVNSEIVNNKQLPNLERNKDKNIKNISPFKLSIKRYGIDEKIVSNSDSSDCDLNIQNQKKPTNSPKVVDLTTDSPEKNRKSPILTILQESNTGVAAKSQQNRKLLSQPRLSGYLIRSKNVNSNKVDFTQAEASRVPLIKNNASKPSTRTKTHSKLQLTKKSERNPVTSTKWFKKNVAAPIEQNVSASSSFKVNTSKLDRLSLTSSKSSSSEDATAVVKTNDKDTVSPVLNANKIIKQRDVMKTVANLDSSDDDFEFSSKKSTGWIKPKLKNVENRKLPLGKDVKKNSVDVKKGKQKISKKLDQCPYFDLEAEVSMDEDVSSDSNVQDVSGDRFEESFVDDENETNYNNTIMHAQYLQSVRSPILNRGKFKIPAQPSTVVNVYSQVVNQGEDSYVNDSFCVNTEDMLLSQDNQNMSELELAELLLEEKRKNRKKKRKKSDNGPNRKRLRVLVESSSDSD